jgi:hypothetical protein
MEFASPNEYVLSTLGFTIPAQVVAPFTANVEVRVTAPLIAKLLGVVLYMKVSGGEPNLIPPSTPFVSAMFIGPVNPNQLIPDIP